MTGIIRYDNSCRLTDITDLEVFKALDKELSFHIQGSEYSAAYQGYFNDAGEFITWDGRRHLLGSTGKFPVGLLPRVLDFYQERRGETLHIIDKRTPKQSSNSFDILDHLQALEKEPRPYQELAAEKAIEEDRGVIRIATGGGKTLVAALIAAKLGKRTIVYVIGKDLLYQLQKFFSQVFGDEIGIIGDGKCEIRDINIATVWSIGQALGLKKNNTLDDSNDDEKKMDPGKFRKIKQMLLDSKVHIMDECHLAACDTVQTISRHIKAEYVYGMSASPWRDDGADLLIEAFLGRKIIDISARELIDKGYLVEPNIRFLAPKPYQYKSGKFPRIYSRYIVDNEQRNAMVVKGATRLVEQGFVPLVLFHTIRHGDILFDELKKKVPTALLSGKDKSKTREKIKGELENGKIKCLIASKIFDIGIDLPILSGLVIAGAGKSSVRALQRIGRVIRPYPGKSMAAILDFADQAPYLSNHANTRRRIYEWEFTVKWPGAEKGSGQTNS
jgi:superfamily II DNA or RNA helicase